MNELGASFGGLLPASGAAVEVMGWRAPIRPVRQHRRDRGPDVRMPLTLLDVILLGVMLMSALLAMIRGFMREVLSIAAWVIAAGVTLYGYARLLPYAKGYFNNDIVAAAVVVAGTFLGTLLIVSVITVRFSD